MASELQSPDVNPDGSIAGGEDEDVRGRTDSDNSRSIIQTVQFRLETGYIRIRAWINTLTHLGAISMFLLGLFAIYDSTTVSVGAPTFLGVEVPGVAGLDPFTTYLYGGIFVMMLGLGLAYRWVVSDRATY